MLEPTNPPARVVAAIMQRADRRILIGQRRKTDSSPLKWEFPGGKMKEGETPEAALARELREELGVTMHRAVEITRVRYRYPDSPRELQIQFFAVEVAPGEPKPLTFEQIAWVLPRELGDYDFLAANERLVAALATGRIKPADLLSS